jgi:hypothetical protein
MARKYSSKKRMNKIEPSVMTMAFTIPAPGGVVSYIDLSQVASLVNRRFYRQGINWAVGGFKVLTDAGVTGSVKIAKLPNTWVMSNSWQKSFSAWQRMNREALEENESVRPKFLDFKIYADSVHHGAGFTANLLPVNASGVVGTYIAGEWEPSKIVVPAAVNAAASSSFSRELIATGASYSGVGASGFDAVSLIEGYAASRGLPAIQDPNTPDDMVDSTGLAAENWLTAMFSDGVVTTDVVLDDMAGENNIAPYPFENDGVSTDTMYPGGANQGSGLEFHDFEFVSATTVGGTTRLKGGNFPCGLIQISSNFAAPALSEFNLLIDLIPGNHRGYLCEPMTEM